MAHLEGRFLDDLSPVSKYQEFRDLAMQSPGRWVVVRVGERDEYDQVKTAALSAAGSKNRKTRNKPGNGIEASVRIFEEDGGEVVFGMIRYEEEA